MKYLLMGLLSVVLLIGCSNSGETMTEEDVERLELLREVKPSMGDDKDYNLYVFFEFYDGSLDKEQLTEGAKQRDLYDELHRKIDMSKVNQITYKTNTMNSKEKDLLGITDVPTFIVLDKSGIVLQTNNLDEVITLVNE